MLWLQATDPSSATLRSLTSNFTGPLKAPMKASQSFR